MAPPTYGRRGGIAWTRTSTYARDGEVRYVGRLPDAWLVVSLGGGGDFHPGGESAALDLFVQGISYTPEAAGTAGAAGAGVDLAR